MWARFQIPLSIRACGFPAHGLPMIFLASRREPRIADRAHQLVKAQLPKPVSSPLIGLSGAQVATVALDKQAPQSPGDVAVDLGELVGGVPAAKVASPAAQDRV